MKGLWINLSLMLVLSIAIPVSYAEAFSVGTQYAEKTLAKDLPFLDQNVPAEARKENSKKSYIAQDFFPIVVIADASYVHLTHLHYLPLYGLRREKEFFLLI